MPPASFGGESEDALNRRLPGDREINSLGSVLGGAVQLVDERGAGRGTGPPLAVAAQFVRLLVPGCRHRRREETSCCRSPTSPCRVRTALRVAPGPCRRLRLRRGRRNPAAPPHPAAAAAGPQPPPPWRAAARSPDREACSARRGTRVIRQEMQSPLLLPAELGQSSRLGPAQDGIANTDGMAGNQRADTPALAFGGSGARLAAKGPNILQTHLIVGGGPAGRQPLASRPRTCFTLIRDHAVCCAAECTARHQL